LRTFNLFIKTPAEKKLLFLFVQKADPESRSKVQKVVIFVFNITPAEKKLLFLFVQKKETVMKL